MREAVVILAPPAEGPRLTPPTRSITAAFKRENSEFVFSELEALKDLTAIPEIPVWLVGRRALRNLPRIEAVWAFLEELSVELA